jgi:hypothetical protein
MPELPAELRPSADLIVVGRLPSFIDQVYAYATEEELGLQPTPLEDVLLAVDALPFWPSMQALARLQRDLWFVRTDEAGQLALVRQWYGNSRYAQAAEAWMQQERRVVFSEQQLFALQRLVMLHARDSAVDEQFSEQEHLLLRIALAAVPGSVLGPQMEALEEADAIEDEEWVRYFIGHGGFIGGQGGLRNEIGRAHRLYAELANDDEAHGHNYCPLNEWLCMEYGLGFIELQAFAFSLHAGSNMLNAEETPSVVGEEFFSTTRLAAKAREGLDALSAPRDWYLPWLEKTQGDPRRAAFEITPFQQRPALRQPNGRVMVLAPRALEAWMGATGHYYRLLDIARAKGDVMRNRFASFNGALVEAYALDVAEQAYPSKSGPSVVWLPGTVHGDKPYPAKGGERRTPDISIDLTPDLVLLEITSSRLTVQSLIDADPEAVRKDIEKVLTNKIGQLGAAIEDIRLGVVMLDGVEIDQIERIWPIVVISEGVFQTPTLWSYITPVVNAALGQPKVQPLTILDLEDLEEVMGLVASGASIVEILRNKTSARWQQLEFAMWFQATGKTRYGDESPIDRRQFDIATDAIARLLMGDEAVEAYQASAGDS